MKCKIFVSCMGWGHTIRQLTVLKKLYTKFPNLDVTIQKNKQIGFERKFIKKKFNIIKDDNLIKFFVKKRGQIDFDKTKKYYDNYQEKSDAWIEKHLKDKNYDFFISDISPEGIFIGDYLKKPVFGICHFTWDWFFTQKLPLMIKPKILNKWINFQKKATKIFFPPLTPSEIISKYKNHQKVEFISSQIKKIKTFKNSKKIKILFLDSGNMYLSNDAIKIMKLNKENKNFFFFTLKILWKI